MNTIITAVLIALSLGSQFTHRTVTNDGQQRAQAQSVILVTVEIEEETVVVENVVVENVENNEVTCNLADTVPAAPQLSDYLDGDTDTVTANSDYLEDLAWWYAEFNVCQ